MNPSRLPPQIVRLVLLTLLVIATYAVARVVLTPPTFGHYGHYRGAALLDAAAKPVVYAGAKACDECHSDTGELLGKARHKGISCESCHGPSRPHARNPDLGPPKLDDALCLRCHVADAARPTKHRQIQLLDHFPGEKCMECHVAHQPNKSK
jgi:hypothetical protein